jgi:hypothetical protein
VTLIHVRELGLVQVVLEYVLFDEHHALHFVIAFIAFVLVFLSVLGVDVPAKIGFGLARVVAHRALERLLGRMLVEVMLFQVVHVYTRHIALINNTANRYQSLFHQDTQPKLYLIALVLVDVLAYVLLEQIVREKLFVAM